MPTTNQDAHPVKTKLRTFYTHAANQLTHRRLTAIWVAALTFTIFVSPAAAQDSSQPIMTTVENATAWLTGIGPAVGTLNAGFNMMKASGTNKSGKKKEYKENIRSSLMYGWGLGMLMGITSLITRWTGVGA